MEIWTIEYFDKDIRVKKSYKCMDIYDAVKEYIGDDGDTSQILQVTYNGHLWNE